MISQWMPNEIKKKNPQINKFHKLQENGKDLETKVLAFVYSY